jgi:NAD(P)H-hydrate epimerase
MFLFPGKDITGEVWVADIGIPEVSFASVTARTNLVTTQLSQTLLPPRSPDSHKGTNGKLLILAGSNQYPGAAVITSYGALRSGAGLVTLAMPESLKGNLSFQLLPETILDFMPASDGKFNLSSKTVDGLNSRYRTILAGPGWGRSKETEKSVKALISNWEGQLVLDADALNSIKQPELLKEARQIALITPHLTEMSRLTGKSIEEVQKNQLEIAAEFARDNRTIVVLKSAVTVIADHNGRLFISSRPNSGLARGGSGDLLAGLVAGLATTGISPLNAAIAGVHLLADSAEFAVAELGADAVTVSEIASFIPRAFRKLRQELPEVQN